MTLFDTIDTPQQQRIALLLEYNGSGFSGSQFQPEQPTVQGIVMNALAKLGLQVSGYMMSGRTDAGVHARGQVAHFDVPTGSLNNIPNLVLAMNSLLPETVRVRDAVLDAGLSFHSQRHAEYKWYRYTVYNAPQPSVWAPADSAWVRKPLDVDAMNACARLMFGAHNFKSYKSPNTPVKDDVCTVLHANVHRDGSLVMFDIVADRFLYKMVRNLMGQLLAVGTEQVAPESFLSVLEQQDRTAAAITADAAGLNMMAVCYQPGSRFFESDAYVQTARQLVHNTNLLKLNNTESMQNEQDLFRKAS